MILRAIRGGGLVAVLGAAAVPAIPASAWCAQAPATRDSTHKDSLPVTLIGHVTDSTGAGLAGAEVNLLHADRFRAITGDSGEFRIAGLPPGTSVFNVRRLGFEAASFTAVLHSGRTQRATFKLTAIAQALPTVAVADTSPKTHWLDSFDRRKGGGRGVFITRDEIERRNARSGTDVVRNVAGIRIVPLRGGVGNQVLMNRGSGARACTPTMFVHNTPYSGMLDDFTADDIEALEVYVGISEIPPELDKNGKGICGAIVVWTRDPSKKPDKP